MESDFQRWTEMNGQTLMNKVRTKQLWSIMYNILENTKQPPPTDAHNYRIQRARTLWTSLKQSIAWIHYEAENPYMICTRTFIYIFHFDYFPNVEYRHFQYFNNSFSLRAYELNLIAAAFHPVLHSATWFLIVYEIVFEARRT